MYVKNDIYVSDMKEEIILQEAGYKLVDNDFNVKINEQLPQNWEWLHTAPEIHYLNDEGDALQIIDKTLL